MPKQILLLQLQNHYTEKWKAQSKYISSDNLAEYVKTDFNHAPKIIY